MARIRPAREILDPVDCMSSRAVAGGYSVMNNEVSNVPGPSIHELVHWLYLNENSLAEIDVS